MSRHPLPGDVTSGMRSLLNDCIRLRTTAESSLAIERFVSPRTIHENFARICRLLRAANRFEAILRALELGLVQVTRTTVDESVMPNERHLTVNMISLLSDCRRYRTMNEVKTARLRAVSYHTIHNEFAEICARLCANSRFAAYITAAELGYILAFEAEDYRNGSVADQPGG